jgi:hypothetical protein
MDNVTAELVAYFVGSVVGSSLVLALLWAFLLMIMGQKLYSVKLQFGEAYRICLIGLLAGNLLTVPIILAFPATLHGLWNILLVVFVVLIYSAITGQMIRLTPAERAGFLKAFTLAGIKLTITFAIVFVLTIIFGLLWGVA